MSGIRGQRVGFGVELSHSFDPDHLVDDARKIEALGFDLLSVSDHLHTERPSYEPWTALTCIATVTDRIHVLPNVLGLPYRDPAVTAKMAETLDRLSGARLVLGLGVGGYDPEFAAFGLAQRTPVQKVSALGEAVRIIQGLWTQETVSFAGEYFQVERARIEPKPTHRLPIWLGTYGPRALKMTGALADGWIPSLPRLELDHALSMRAAVRTSALKSGRNPDDITCACNVIVRFDPTLSPTPQLIAGRTEAIADQLLAIIRAGFTFPIVTLPEPELRERFAVEVIPLVRHELALT